VRLADTALTMAPEGEDRTRALAMSGAAYANLSLAVPEPGAAFTAVLRLRGARDAMTTEIDLDFDVWLHCQTSSALSRLALINNDGVRLGESIAEANAALAKARTAAQRAQALDCRGFAELALGQGDPVEAIKALASVKAAIAQSGETPSLLLTLSQALLTRSVDRLSRQDAQEALAAGYRGLDLGNKQLPPRTNALLVAAAAAAHAKLGEFDRDAAELRKAVALYSEALILLRPPETKEFETPADWNELRLNYGDALVRLAELESDLSSALEAVAMLGDARTAISVRGASRSADRAQIIHVHAMVIAARLGAPPFFPAETEQPQGKV